MCIAGGVQESRVWTCVFGSLQVLSDEEMHYSCFAGERQVVYHGLPGLVRTGAAHVFGGAAL